MSEDLKELKEDVKHIKSAVEEIKLDIKGNSVSLDAHMHRTELNERRIQSLEYWLLGILGSSLMAVLVRLFLKQ